MQLLHTHTHSHSHIHTKNPFFRDIHAHPTENSHLVPVCMIGHAVTMPVSAYAPAPSLLRCLPPPVPTSTEIVYAVLSSRPPMTTLEFVELRAVLETGIIRPTSELGWYVTKYTGNPLAWWRVSGVQLTRALLLLWILSTFTLLTWAVGAGCKFRTRFIKRHELVILYRIKSRYYMQ